MVVLSSYEDISEITIVKITEKSRTPWKVLFNQIVVHGALVLAIDYLYPEYLESLPNDELSVSDILTFVFSIDLSNTLFYFIHRLFHSVPWLLRYHEHHHKNVEVNSIDTFDSGVVEHLMLNIGTTLFPPLFLGLPLFLVQFQIMSFMILAIISHSSLQIPFLSTPYHQIHHRNRMVNFGQGLYLYDRLCGSFRSS